MLSAFTSTLHVPNLSKPDHVLSVLEDSDLFNKQELSTLAKRMSGHRYNKIYLNASKCDSKLNHVFRVFIGIKKLLDLMDMARQTESQYRVVKFLTKLEEEGGLMSNSSK